MGNDIVKPSRMLKSVLFVALLVALASQSSGIPEDTFVPETTFREDDADRAYPDTEGASEATEVQESAQHIFKHIAKHFDAVKKHVSKIVNDAAKHSGLQNAGKDCWQGCRTKQGQCSWCGTGSCCRMGWKGNGCDGTMGILGKGHVCVAGHAKKHAKKDDGRRRRRKADEGRRRRRKAEKKEQDMKEKAAKKDAAKKKHFDECRKNEEKCHAKYADLKNKHAEQEAKAYHHHTKSKARIHWTELWKLWLHTERAKHAAMAKEHAGLAAKLKAEVKKRDKHCVDALIKCLKEDDEEEDDDDEEDKHPKHPHYKPHYKRL